MDNGSRPGLKSVQQVQIVATAIAVSPVIYLVIGLVLNKTQGPFIPNSGLGMPLAVLVGVGVVMGFVGFFVRTLMHSPATAAKNAGSDTLGYFLRGVIFSLGFAEMPAIFGLVRFLLVGGRTLFLCAIAASLAFAFTMFPTQGQYDEMCSGLESTPPASESEQEQQ